MYGRQFSYLLEALEWRLGWLAKGPVLPAPSRSILERPEKKGL